MVIHIYIGDGDIDLLRLYKYVPYGLGKLFKDVVISYYKNEKVKLPELKYQDKNNIKDVKVYFSNKDLKVIYPLLDIENKSSAIKNITRMQYGSLLSDICKSVYRVPKKKEVNQENKQKNNIEQEKEQERIQEKEQERIQKREQERQKMPNVFMPKEY